MWKSHSTFVKWMDDQLLHTFLSFCFKQFNTFTYLIFNTKFMKSPDNFAFVKFPITWMSVFQKVVFKVHIFWEGQTNLNLLINVKNSGSFFKIMNVKVLYPKATKIWEITKSRQMKLGKCFKFFWPTQITWTLITKNLTLSHCV